MARTRRGAESSEADDLINAMNSSPANKKKKANSKKDKSAADAQKLAEKIRFEKIARAQALVDIQKTSDSLKAEYIEVYGEFPDDIALILAKSDAEIYTNIGKVAQYSLLLSSFNHKKHPNSVAPIKARIKRYNDHVKRLQKSKTALIKSSEKSWGMKPRDNDLDPEPFISSDEEDEDDEEDEAEDPPKRSKQRKRSPEPADQLSDIGDGEPSATKVTSEVWEKMGGVFAADAINPNTKRSRSSSFSDDEE